MWVVNLPEGRSVPAVTEELPEVPSTNDRFAGALEFVFAQMGTYAVAF